MEDELQVQDQIPGEQEDLLEDVVGTSLLYDVITRTTTFFISYLLYLLIMFIVLDFWDKLKGPSKEFLREKFTKYVGQETLTEYFKQLGDVRQVVERMDSQPGRQVDGRQELEGGEENGNEVGDIDVELFVQDTINKAVKQYQTESESEKSKTE